MLTKKFLGANVWFCLVCMIHMYVCMIHMYVWYICSLPTKNVSAPEENYSRINFRNCQSKFGIFFTNYFASNHPHLQVEQEGGIGHAISGFWIWSCHRREVLDTPFRDSGSEAVTGGRYWTRHFGILDLKLSQEGGIGHAISGFWIWKLSQEGGIGHAISGFWIWSCHNTSLLWQLPDPESRNGVSNTSLLWQLQIQNPEMACPIPPSCDSFRSRIPKWRVQYLPPVTASDPESRNGVSNTSLLWQLQIQNPEMACPIPPSCDSFRSRIPKWRVQYLPPVTASDPESRNCVSNTSLLWQLQIQNPEMACPIPPSCEDTPFRDSGSEAVTGGRQEGDRRGPEEEGGRRKEEGGRRKEEGGKEEGGRRKRSRT